MARILLQRISNDHKVIDTRLVSHVSDIGMLTHPIQRDLFLEHSDFFDAMVPETFYDNLIKIGRVDMFNTRCTTISDGTELFIITLVDQYA